VTQEIRSRERIEAEEQVLWDKANRLQWRYLLWAAVAVAVCLCFAGLALLFRGPLGLRVGLGVIAAGLLISLACMTVAARYLIRSIRPYYASLHDRRTLHPERRPSRRKMAIIYASVAAMCLAILLVSIHARPF